MRGSQEVPSNSIVLKLDKEALTGHLIERLGEVEEYNVNLLFFIKSSAQVINCHNQLCFTKSTFPKSMLTVSKYVVAFKVVYYTAIDFMFQHLACD